MDNQVEAPGGVSFKSQVSSASINDYGSGKSTTAVASPIDKSDALALVPADIDNNQPVITSSDIHLPMQATNDDDNKRMVIVPFTRKDVACKGTVYVTHGNDSKEWVMNILKLFLIKLRFEVITVSDLIPGTVYHTAHTNFIYKANKIIVVISKLSIKNKLFLYDIGQALSKDNPGTNTRKISQTPHKDVDPGLDPRIIPIIYENATPNDIPKEIVHLTYISYNDPEFKEKIKESVYS